MFTEDLDSFLDDFGLEVAFTRATVPVVTSKLIFDAPTSEVAIYDRSFYDEKFYEAKVQGSSVTLLGVEATLASVQINDVATVNAVDWYVVTKEPDGTGFVTIRLSTQAIISA